MPFSPITRTRGPYTISSNSSLLSLPAINTAFASSQCYWARSLSAANLETLIANSFCLGLYYNPPPPATPSDDPNSTSPTTTTEDKPSQIGFARLVTDYVTSAYLTDVYVLPEHQGKGLGKWLIEVTAKVLEGMPELRRALLITGKGQPERFYGEVLGAKRVGEEERWITMHVPGPASFERRGAVVTGEDG